MSFKEESIQLIATNQFNSKFKLTQSSNSLKKVDASFSTSITPLQSYPSLEPTELASLTLSIDSSKVGSLASELEPPRSQSQKA